MIHSHVTYGHSDDFSCHTVNPKTGKPAGMIAQDVYDVIMANAERLDSAIIYNRDFNYN